MTPADHARDAMAAAALELRARRALDEWEREAEHDRWVKWTGGLLMASDHGDIDDTGGAWCAPDHVTLARKMGLL